MSVVTMTPRPDQPCSFVIEGEMNIYTALALKDRLLSPLDQCTDLQFDLSGVTEIDSAGVQLLVLVKNECGARGKELRITGHSAPVKEIMDLYNLESFLGDPVSARSQEQ